ncbi:MAG: ribose 5-phosphate isomerase B, partial [Oscillospiraceae bacterium]
HLKEKEIEFIDCGCYTADSVDYPDMAEKVCKSILGGESERGILVCGTGIGISISANKFKGIRAACCSDAFSAKYTRLHNDANILCMGGRVVGGGLACMMVDEFLGTDFEGGRHQRRIDKITEIENNQ